MTTIGICSTSPARFGHSADARGVGVAVEGAAFSTRLAPDAASFRNAEPSSIIGAPDGCVSARFELAFMVVPFRTRRMVALRAPCVRRQKPPIWPERRNGYFYPFAIDGEAAR